jgi:hypothetical protein|tara:strand:+ start:5659 stop:7671 length:2013 start_codon:yes stop_codon:yes gene_type:complete
MARKYTKKSDYWENRGKKPQDTLVPTPSIESDTFEPELVGQPFYLASASQLEVQKRSLAAYSRTTAGPKRSRVNAAALDSTYDPYSAIRRGVLPFNYSDSSIDVRDTILLCQKAYANVAIFRNAVDIMSEFTNADIYLKDGSKKSREFFSEWFKRIGLDTLKDQYFREYYRSGNIFLYRIEGKFESIDFIQLINQMSNNPEIASNNIPLRYVLLNPYDIVAQRATAFSDGSYEKLLSEYEIARLRNPQNEIDEAVLDGLPDDAKTKIKNNEYNQDGINIKLDPGKLFAAFYKKQDYEPFAIPFGFPVLQDINAKLELKKMDQSITRTVENVILLITMGAEPDKGGINAKNIVAMQNLFGNESVGRVLISDYTTKADFVIPDLKKVLGPEKYTTLNEDIRQGLQNIVVGEEKFSSTQVKAEIFLDRLKEARQSFIVNFLQKEIKQVADNLGFRTYPTACFKDIDMRDETQLMRVTTRLMELGILTPAQGMEMFNNGRFPEAEELEEGHEEFIKKRKKGFYNPIVGGVPVISSPSSPDAAKNKTNEVAGRPEGTTGIPIVKAATYSRSGIQKTVGSIEKLRTIIEKAICKKHKIKKLSEAQTTILDTLCESVVCSTSEENWEKVAVSCVTDPKNIASLNVHTDVLEISAEHQLGDYPAAILYHSKENEKPSL